MSFAHGAARGSRDHAPRAPSPWPDCACEAPEDTRRFPSLPRTVPRDRDAWLGSPADAARGLSSVRPPLALRLLRVQEAEGHRHDVLFCWN